ncbi:MAG: radical SAM protein [Blautia sp.]|nr:radical SAM protein [Blautia sp.]
MRILVKADGRVEILLGSQREPLCDANGRWQVKLSQYAYLSENAYVLFHELTREMVSLTKEEWEELDDFRNGENEEKDVTPLMQQLFSHHFLVASTRNELKYYQQLMGLIEIAFPVKKGIYTYTILPTTACNARCVYCYEEGIHALTMKQDTIDQLIRYILETRGNGRIHLNWFGGEPLVGSGMIRQVCEALAREKVPFDSAMVSNGALFTPELVREARERWHMNRIQISLDGEKADYLQRKRYYQSWEGKEQTDPYETVLTNVAALVKMGILVSLRCNCDWDNLSGINAFIEDLERRFSPWPKQLSVYFAPLNQESEADRFPALHEKLIGFTALCRKKGFQTGIQGFGYKLRLRHCMADSLANQRLIDPSGRLYDCEHMPESRSYGDIWHDVTDPELVKSLCDHREVREKCRDCVFLPECTPYTKCPIEVNSCREINVQRLENIIREKLEGIGYKEAQPC